jgi:hypothetical protein
MFTQMLSVFFLRRTLRQAFARPRHPLLHQKVEALDDSCGIPHHQRERGNIASNRQTRRRKGPINDPRMNLSRGNPASSQASNASFSSSTEAKKTLAPAFKRSGQIQCSAPQSKRLMRDRGNPAQSRSHRQTRRSQLHLTQAWPLTNRANVRCRSNSSSSLAAIGSVHMAREYSAVVLTAAFPISRTPHMTA